MKVVFLDIDGVLNTGRMMRKTGRQQPFDPEAITALNHILTETDAKIVVSSAWRINRSLKELEEILMLEGVVPRRVIGKTEWLRYGDRIEFQPGQYMYKSDERYKEIAEWIDRHPTVTKWAVIDDDDDAGPENLFQTDFEVGLTLDMAKKIVAKLNS